MSDNIIKWGDPPEKTDRRGSRGLFDVTAVLDELQDHPSEWGVVAEDVSQSYAHTSPLVKALKSDGCEVRTARQGDSKKYALYVRYIPQSRQRGRRAA